MLDDWEENLAVITANRTKDDELVLIHLGDCLWKERSDVCLMPCFSFVLLSFSGLPLILLSASYIHLLKNDLDCCCTHLLSSG